MAKRPSDTAAIAAKTPPRTRGDDAESHTVNVEPIDNGYIITECHAKNGEFTTSRRFSADRPNLGPTPSVGVDGDGVSLARAIDHAKGRT